MTQVSGEYHTATQSLLEDALIELLRTNSLDRITVRDIVGQAHVGRSTFYNHYQDKFELLNSLVDEETGAFSRWIIEDFNDRELGEALGMLLDELAPKREKILILLSIKTKTADLNANYRRIVRAALTEHMIPKLTTHLPLNYLQDFCVDTVMTQIDYQLRHGKQPQLLDFWRMVKQALVLPAD
ncbi:TetR/AcrR family transcriptional regulator [Levilactobacillus bambusae]|uniref:HTH tetR-type domain-containing protein n=1 Tax=Levilactobacillus bambusae TaxID=2024736 RepID=A0A2V1N1U3_9LACO|nr:TetR/AcrR family transcriptional regulator [Levilactobacillus bambusae]PWG00240.1 hypothetical protein DCM90_04710 [Levilactobacillus bambusae]